MSFEKQEKGGGTRHKARECALQMLFAADFLGQQGSFNHKDYWSSLGLEQLHKGTNELVESVPDLIDRSARTVESIRGIIKEVDIVDKKSSRYERLRRLDSNAATLNKEFSARIGDFLSTAAFEDQNLLDLIADSQRIFDAFENDARTGTSIERRVQLLRDFEDSTRLFRSHLGDVEKALAEVGKVLIGLTPFMQFADELVSGTLEHLNDIDDKIRTRAEHWRIERMAIVDRNVLRLAVFEFLYRDTPNTVAINEALETARRFSSFESTQFINGILDAIRQDLDKNEAATASSSN